MPYSRVVRSLPFLHHPGYAVLNMNAKCPNAKTVNAQRCTCTYAGCPRHGHCCDCLHYHLSERQLPACCFPPEVERTYDRSFERFAQCVSGRE